MRLTGSTGTLLLPSITRECHTVCCWPRKRSKFKVWLLPNAYCMDSSAKRQVVGAWTSGARVESTGEWGSSQSVAGMIISESPPSMCLPSQNGPSCYWAPVGFHNLPSRSQSCQFLFIVGCQKFASVRERLETSILPSCLCHTQQMTFSLCLWAGVKSINSHVSTGWFFNQS